MVAIADLAIRHLALRLRPLSRVLQRAVDRQASLSGQLLRPDVTPLCVSDEQVSLLLAEIETDVTRAPEEDWWTATDAERAQERQLRAAAAELKASLPLDQLRERSELSEEELRMLLVCIAPEIERAYERIYAYVLDDLNRRFACVELVVQLCARDWTSRMHLHGLVGPTARLRRLGLIESVGDAPTGLRQQLTCPGRLVEFLLGANAAFPFSVRDPDEVGWSTLQALPPGTTRAEIDRLGDAVRGGVIDCVGIWGSEVRGAQAAIQLLAEASARPLRRFRPVPGQNNLRAAFAEAEARAAALNAVLWLDVDRLEPPLLDDLTRALEAEATRLRAPLLLSARHPWRPLVLLQSRRYAEVELADFNRADRLNLLRGLRIDGIGSITDDLAGRYRLGPAEIAAFANLVSVDVALRSGTPEAAVARAAALVTHRGSSSYATVTEPDRPPSDLVLPDDTHREVLQIADFYRAWPRVKEDWRLGRLAQGGGMKALFTGDSGTGKTLAAEVIASLLEAPLMKVELSQVVSKWVGVTEQQLDCVFREAHEMRAVLFFDEADALFGKRGEVEHGVDRYANMEVSYLLQKLEDPGFSGLVLFATNLQDNIDQAFARRFQFVLNFPRPSESDRRKIWQLALPRSTPVAADVELDDFARLDLTGAGIMSAARTAALLAVSTGSTEITGAHIANGIRRQFRSEARMLLDSDLTGRGGPRTGASTSALP